MNGRSDPTHGDHEGQQLGTRLEPPCHVTGLRGGDKRGSARPAPPGPRACAPSGALKFKFERPWSAREPAPRAEPTGCGRARRPASCLPPELRRARTHFFPSPEFEPPNPPSRLPHVRPGAMDPFTEVRDSAGAVNHDPCGPPSALPVSLRPTGGPRGACAPRACCRAEAAGSQAACRSGCRGGDRADLDSRVRQGRQGLRNPALAANSFLHLPSASAGSSGVPLPSGSR